MSFCVKCGSRYEEDELFCGSCGQPLQESAPRAARTAASIDFKKAFIGYFKSPVVTTKALVCSLEAKFTAIITVIIVLLTAFIPFKPIKSAVSQFMGKYGDADSLDVFSKSISDGINSKVNGLYFSFLLFVILFFTLSTLLLLIYSAIRGRKENFLRILNLVILSSIPSVLFMLLSLLFGMNSFSLVLILFGFVLSIIIFYAQVKEVIGLSEMDSFIALVVVNFLSYGITFYVAFETLKAKLSAMENFF